MVYQDIDYLLYYNKLKGFNKNDQTKHDLINILRKIRALLKLQSDKPNQLEKLKFIVKMIQFYQIGN